MLHSHIRQKMGNVSDAERQELESLQQKENSGTISNEERNRLQQLKQKSGQ